MDSSILRKQIFAVNQAFYEKVYQDPWLSKVFQVVPQAHIENQQTDFMVGAMGGEKKYFGRAPNHAHPHIYVDEEMWQLREKFLKQAFEETKFPEDLRVKWIKIDEAFKEVIVKKSLSDCERRYATDEIIYFPSASSKKAA